jgi:hypothetical protein
MFAQRAIMATSGKTATKGNRSDNFNLRFDPRLKYLAGIQARNERRTLSHLVESAVEAYLQSSGITTNGKKESMIALSDDLWSISQGGRFVLLAENFPHLLTFEEEYLWEIIQELEMVTPDRWDELDASFTVLQDQAINQAHNAPIVSVGGFPSRGGRIDSSIPASIVSTTTRKTKKGSKS